MRALLSDKEKEQIASEIIKKNMDKANSSATISTHGRGLVVARPPKPSKTRAPGQVSASALLKQMKHNRTSLRGIEKYQE